MDERFVKLIKESIDEYDEVGAWFEITEELAKKSGVKWRAKLLLMIMFTRDIH